MTETTDGGTRLQPGGMLVSTADRAGLLRLDHRGSGGRVSLEMRRAVAAGLETFARDPHIYCAILDSLDPSVFGLGDGGLEQAGEAAIAMAYQDLWRIDRFIKPQIALIQGRAQWPAFSLAAFGTHRVADPGAAFTVCDVAEGGVPGWGASYLLPRLPGRLGLHLALTGAAMDTAMACRVGWLTHCIPASRFGEIAVRLSRADPVDQVLDEIEQQPGFSVLDPHLETIERCFSADSIGAVLGALEATVGAQADWARASAAAMRAMPSRALEATWLLLTRHAQPTLRDALMFDCQLAGQRSGGQSPDPAQAFEARPPHGNDTGFPIVEPPSIG